MSKQIVHVFPDYCSSGLWSGKPRVNYHASAFEDVLKPIHLLALRYWHNAWEDYVDGCKYYQQWQDRWEADGRALVASFNECQDVYEFIYIGDNF